ADARAAGCRSGRNRQALAGPVARGAATGAADETDLPGAVAGGAPEPERRQRANDPTLSGNSRVFGLKRASCPAGLGAKNQLQLLIVERGTTAAFVARHVANLGELGSVSYPLQLPPCAQDDGGAAPFAARGRDFCAKRSRPARRAKPQGLRA